MRRTAILLINVGTPISPEPKDVGKYLNEFLMDPEVIRLPWLFRKILVSGIIAPFRAKKSSLNYKKIWTKDGSPLLTLSTLLVDKLNSYLPDHQRCILAMRYGQPSIENALLQIQKEKFQDLFILPLYPQYARATTETSFVQVQKLIKRLDLRFDHVDWISSFYEEDFFIRAFCRQILRFQLKGKTLLLSYHGLPESHVYSETQCHKDHRCCERQKEAIQHCYRAQCHQTSRKIQAELGLKSDQVKMCFQSQLGRGEWLKPSTRTTIIGLADQGEENLVVACPSFVTDCLETLEEIAVEGRDIFLKNGGKSFELVPCPNEDDSWAKDLAHFIQQRIGIKQD